MKIKKIVEEILEKYPETRDDDKELLLVYYHSYTNSIKPAEFIRNHFKFIKSFIRYRAHFQNKEGKYPSTSKIKKKRDAHRKVKQKEFREYNGRNIEGTYESSTKALYDMVGLPTTEVQGKKVEEDVIIVYDANNHTHGEVIKKPFTFLGIELWK